MMSLKRLQIKVDTNILIYFPSFRPINHVWQPLLFSCIYFCCFSLFKYQSTTNPIIIFKAMDEIPNSDNEQNDMFHIEENSFHLAITPRNQEVLQMRQLANLQFVMKETEENESQREEENELERLDDNERNQVNLLVHIQQPKLQIQGQGPSEIKQELEREQSIRDDDQQENLEIQRSDKPKRGKKKKVKAKKNANVEKCGLSNIAKWSYQIVREKRDANYTNVASEIFAQKWLPMNANLANQVLTQDMKHTAESNIKRRVYDALNVMLVLGVIIKKERVLMLNEIKRKQWEKFKKLKEGYKLRIAALEEMKKRMIDIIRYLETMLKRNQGILAGNQNTEIIQMPFGVIATEKLIKVEKKGIKTHLYVQGGCQCYSQILGLEQLCGSGKYIDPGKKEEEERERREGKKP